MTAERPQGKTAGWVRCPTTIKGSRWVKLWASAQKQLIHQETWRLTDATQLEDWVLAKKAASDAQDQVDVDGLVVRGSKGQPRPHPMLAVKSAQLDLAYRIAEALRLTARARAASKLDAAGVDRSREDDDQYGGMD